MSYKGSHLLESPLSSRLGRSFRPNTLIVDMLTPPGIGTILNLSVRIAHYENDGDSE